MRSVLTLDSYSGKRLATAGLLLVAACCFLPFLAMGLSRESFNLLLLPIVAVWFAILAVSRPAAALMVYVFLAVVSMRYEFLVLQGESVSGGIFLSQVLLAVLLIGWVMRYTARLERERRASLSFSLPLLGLAVIPFVSVLSAYVTWDPEVSVIHRKPVVQLAGASLIFLAAAAAFLTAVVVKKVSHARTLITIMVGIAALAFFDAFGLLSTPGTALIFVVAPLAFSFALYAPNHLRRFLWLTLLIPPFIISIQAIKITLLVALILPMLFISFAHSRRAFLITLAALMAGYLILGAALGRSPGLKVYEKAKKMKDFDRIILFQKAVGTWKEHPLFGVGPGGQFAYLDGEHFYGTTHSLYGNFLMETGLFGMIFLLWVIGAALRMGWKAFRSCRYPQAKENENSELAFIRSFTLGQTGGFLGMAVAGLFSDTMLPAVQNGGMHMFGASVYLWILLGITAAFRRMQLEGRVGRATDFNLHSELEHTRSSA